MFSWDLYVQDFMWSRQNTHQNKAESLVVLMRYLKAIFIENWLGSMKSEKESEVEWIPGSGTELACPTKVHPAKENRFCWKISWVQQSSWQYVASKALYLNLSALDCWTKSRSSLFEAAWGLPDLDRFSYLVPLHSVLNAWSRMSCLLADRFSSHTSLV